MNIEDGGQHEKECCKEAVLAYKQEVSRRDAKIASLRIRALMALMAIGFTLMFILDPPKVWVGLFGFMAGASVVWSIALIIEFYIWDKARKSIK